MALTSDYSLGRIFPTTGLYTWQLAEVLRRVGFAPLIYSREELREGFESILYTYVESGLPLLIAFEQHVVAAFGHVIDESGWSGAPDDGYLYSWFRNAGYIINDDNGFPYQFLGRDGPGAHGGSEYSFDDIARPIHAF